jgi:hypothetical protein
MSLRDDMLPVVDGLRGLFSEFGVARYAFAIRRITWSGGKRGLGVATPVDTPIVSASGGSPLVQPVSTREIAASAGTFQEGDLRISGITPHYAGGGFTPAQLRPQCASDAEEIIYVLTGDEGEVHCTLVESKFDDPVEYSLVVRRKRK